MEDTPSSSPNVVWHRESVTRAMRETNIGHRSAALWFTGLSGSGKSTLAHAVDARLFQLGCHTYVFDGDNVRHGLCRDLGFNEKDRQENIRRIGEMVRLFVDAGIIALTAFISPFMTDRQNIRQLLGNDFIEIYCRCPLAVCERRDTKGLYKKARQGLIQNYTGISSPYEEPAHANLVLDTASSSLESCVESIISLLETRLVITPSPPTESTSPIPSASQRTT